jgi:hypothetical protein
MSRLQLTAVRASGEEVEVEVRDFSCFAAGYTGRDRAAIDRHIAELAEHGVAAPAHVPCCYPLLPHLVAVAPAAVDVYGGATSGEIEPVLIVLDGRPRYLGVGSDHTDRDLERVSVPVAKQLCRKVLGRRVWEFAEVAPFWDELQLRSESDGEPYQAAALTALLPHPDLVATVPEERRTAAMVIFGGTVPVLGGLRFGSRFTGELRDPTRGRSLEIGYDVRVLQPID